MDGIAPNIKKNLQSAFRATGICPIDPQVVLRKLPSETNTTSGRVLKESLLEFLKETRGYNSNRIRHQRGKKNPHKPGAQIIQNPEDALIQTMELPSTSKGFKKGPSSKKPPKNKAKIVESDSDDDTPLIELMRKKDDAEDDDNFCSICKCDYNQYRMRADWIRCVTCLKWVCGNCNGESTNPSYMCERCEDEN